MKKLVLILTVGISIVGCSYETINNTTTTTNNNTDNSHDNIYNAKTVDNIGVKYPILTDTIIGG